MIVAASTGGGQTVKGTCGHVELFVDNIHRELFAVGFVERLGT